MQSRRPVGESPEERAEALLRRRPLAVPGITLLAVAGLYAGIGACLRLFDAGFWSVALISGLLVHAFLIVLVHDGAHRAITHSGLDSFLMNLGAGLVLLPFYAEPFRRYHLIHHGHANQPEDPLWTPLKSRLYRDHRRLYMLAEMVPLLFSVLALAFPAPPQRLRPVNGPPVRPAFLALAFAAAIGTWWWVRPAPMFLLLTVLSANAWAALRHWCEHLGLDAGKESNTFRFPLGMGIGNHDAHHRHPGYSWISMAWGLAHRAKDTGPLRTVVAMLSRPDFRHYSPSLD